MKVQGCMAPHCCLGVRAGYSYCSVNGRVASPRTGHSRCGMSGGDVGGREFQRGVAVFAGCSRSLRWRGGASGRAQRAIGVEQGDTDVLGGARQAVDQFQHLGTGQQYPRPRLCSVRTTLPLWCRRCSSIFMSKFSALRVPVPCGAVAVPMSLIDTSPMLTEMGLLQADAFHRAGIVVDRSR